MSKHTLIGSSLRRLALGLVVSLVPATAVLAHHSFAPFDIRNPIEVSGVTEKWVYRRPHPMLYLVDEEGVTWEIEVPIRRWERAGLESDAIKPGDELVVKVFPARNGSPEAAMSGFTLDGTYHSVTEEIRQQSGNEAADAIEAGEDVDEVLERYADGED